MDNAPQGMKHERIDASRFNRKERRRIKGQIGFQIQGRNLPYTKVVDDEKKPGKTRYMSLQEFNELRAKEIMKEEEAQKAEKPSK